MNDINDIISQVDELIEEHREGLFRSDETNFWSKNSKLLLLTVICYLIETNDTWDWQKVHDMVKKEFIWFERTDEEELPFIVKMNEYSEQMPQSLTAKYYMELKRTMQNWIVFIGINVGIMLDYKTHGFDPRENVKRRRKKSK